VKRATAYLVVIALALGGTFAFAQTVAPDKDLNQAVGYLLDFVAQSDSTFVRNGLAYTGKEAADHMRLKYDYYKTDIKTPEDFIRLAGSKSVLSGQPYLVKIADGKQMTAAEWLGRVLSDYRKSPRAAIRPGA
jgi:uncharacterized protein DUF5329